MEAPLAARTDVSLSGAWVSQARGRKRWTIGQLADQANMDRRTVKKAEAGKAIRADVADRLKRALS